jgi:hypothetical protein
VPQRTARHYCKTTIALRLLAILAHTVRLIGGGSGAYC